MKVLMTILIGIGILLAGFTIYSSNVSQSQFTSSPEETPDSVRNTQLTYSSTTLQFMYPAYYELTEHDEPGSLERSHYTITLTRKSDLPVPINGEGPPSITIALFQNNLDALTTDAWITGSNDSNFKLSPDGLISTTTVSKVAARTYRWDGLYPGKTVALALTNYIYAFSVTTGSAEDSILTDFERLLQTVNLR